jgi:polyisoprenoid-binding protein YceI
MARAKELELSKSELHRVERMVPVSPRKQVTSLALIAAVGVSVRTTGLPIIVGQTLPDKTKSAPNAKPIRKPGDIDLEKSRVYVHVGKKGFGHEHAVEGRVKAGSLALNAEGIKDQAIGQIEFDMASFTADTDAARKYLEMKGTESKETQEQVTETMRGDKVLDVEKFPKAVFKIKSAEMRYGRAGDPIYQLKGDFSLHGKTRPLEIHAESELAEGKVRRLRGEFKILQSDFGITPYKAAGGVVGVADQLKIIGDIWITVDEPPQ